MTDRPRLCVTVTGATTAELRARRDAVREADLVELRLDSVEDPDVAGALFGRVGPVIVTCRAAWEGGWFRGSEEERRRLLAEAIASDAEYVDIEWRAGFDDLVRHRQGRGVVLSMHDFDGVPGDLADRVRAMARGGAEVIKAAVAISRLTQCEALLEISRGFEPGRTVLLGMGDAGLFTRVWASTFGSRWTYAGDGVAPGQPSPSQMLREFRFPRIHAGTAIYGLLGQPLHHSLSPAMHNAGFADLGADAAYLPLCAADLGDCAAFCSAFRVEGLSVTAPYKTSVLALAGESTDTAREIGAANTLTRSGDGFVADNTDADGFLVPLGGEVLAGARVALLGTGGAARAVARALRQRSARVAMYGRDAARARQVAAELGIDGYGRPVPAGCWDMLVNATPVGTHPSVGDSACPESRFDGHLVYDLVYNPPETALLRDARRAGCRTIGGLDMLVAQAGLQQERWCGRAPSVEALRDAAMWKLSTFASDV